MGSDRGRLYFPGVCKYDTEQKFIPGPQKGDDRNRCNTDRRYRDNDPEKRSGPGAAVHDGRVYQFLGKGVEKRLPTTDYTRSPNLSSQNWER